MSHECRPPTYLLPQVTAVAIVTAFVGSVIWRVSPLSAIQMLWVRLEQASLVSHVTCRQVNVIMDSFASLALATEPPTDELLNRPPRAKHDSIITRKMVRFIAGSAALQLYVIIGLMYGAQLIPGLCLPALARQWTGALLWQV